MILSQRLIKTVPMDPLVLVILLSITFSAVQGNSYIGHDDSLTKQTL